MKKIGLLINPVAGMGGKVGLKGTDGRDVLEEARKRGARPESPLKAGKALEKFLTIKDQVIFYTAAGDMGENQLENLGLNYEVIHHYQGDSQPEDSYQTLEQFKKLDLDLILFSGGDGTARDVTKYIEFSIPAIGIPAGVKIHSGVYAKTPEAAGELALAYLKEAGLPLKEEEVIDIEENAFRRDEIVIAVYGYLKVPYDDSHLQSTKSPTPQSDEGAQTSAALQFIDLMKDDVLYIIGSGSTCYRILEELNLDGTMLGVDLVQNKKLIARDVNEQEMVDAIHKADQVHLVVTPMGGQGYLFGRGNQQLSNKVLELLSKDQITILSTVGKLNSIQGKPLIVYTGDPKVDQQISGYYRIIIGYEQYRMYKVQPAND